MAESALAMSREIRLLLDHGLYSSIAATPHREAGAQRRESRMM